MTAIERLARLGYAAQGVVYITIGFLAASAPLGRHSATPDRQNAIVFLRSEPLGEPLLVLMVVGLLGYALWRASSGVFDTDHHGRDWKGIALRIGDVLGGVVYALFALEITHVMLQGGRFSGDDSSSQHWTSRVMHHPFGRVGVGLAGLAIIGFGVYEIYCAAKCKLSVQRVLLSERLIRLCRFGIAARALIIIVIGVSLTRAAIRYNPFDARGTSGAFHAIGASPYGRLLLILVGVGFASYGIYAFINAKYRRIQVVTQSGF